MLLACVSLAHSSQLDNLLQLPKPRLHCRKQHMLTKYQLPPLPPSLPLSPSTMPNCCHLTSAPASGTCKVAPCPNYAIYLVLTLSLETSGADVVAPVDAVKVVDVFGSAAVSLLHR